MAPETNLDASVAIAKGEERLGRQRIGLYSNSDFNELNMDWHWEDQFQVRFFLVRSIMLWFPSSVQHFSLFLHSMLHPPSQDFFPTTTITISSSWDHLPSLYELSNPYVILHATTGQEISFLLLLVMDDYSSNWFSHISYVFHLFNIVPILSMTFHLLIQQLLLSYSLLFFSLLSKPPSSYIRPCPCISYFTLDLCNISAVSSLKSRATCFKA